MGHGKLWETLAAGRPEFGNPAVFDNHVDESTWVSFTVSLKRSNLLQSDRGVQRKVRPFSGFRVPNREVFQGH